MSLTSMTITILCPQLSEFLSQCPQRNVITLRTQLTHDYYYCCNKLVCFYGSSLCRKKRKTYNRKIICDTGILDSVILGGILWYCESVIPRICDTGILWYWDSVIPSDIFSARILKSTFLSLSNLLLHTYGALYEWIPTVILTTNKSNLFA